MIVASILETTAERTLARLAELGAGTALAEIRADHLRAGEIEGLVRRAGRDVVVTVRSERDGGAFTGAEAEREAALAAALAAGARFVDVEFEGPLAALARGAFAARTILSSHGSDCDGAVLGPLHRRMSAHGAGVLKIVPRCGAADRIGAVRDLLQAAARETIPLACFALGRAGALSRLLATAWGSWATYGSAAAGVATGAGQFTARDLVELYDVDAIRTETRRFALIGREIEASPSPAMHGAGYAAAGIDARCFPLAIERIEECLPLVGRQGVAGIEALAVTMPFKSEAARRCARLDELSRRAGAVNTVLIDERGRWSGFNTDGPAILDLVRGQLDPAGARAGIVGAGGTARAAAAVLAGAGARVTLYNRSPERARAAAQALGVRAEPLSALAGDGWDLLVQATPLGRGGERILPAEALLGACVVEAVYGVETPLAADARARGLAVIDGLDLLVAQAVRQFERMTGAPARPESFREQAERFLVR